MFHLTVRVAWHDTRWNGRVCRRLSEAFFCTARNENIEYCHKGACHDGILPISTGAYPRGVRNGRNY